MQPACSFDQARNAARLLSIGPLPPQHLHCTQYMQLSLCLSFFLHLLQTHCTLQHCLKYRGACAVVSAQIGHSFASSSAAFSLAASSLAASFTLAASSAASRVRVRVRVGVRVRVRVDTSWYLWQQLPFWHIGLLSCLHPCCFLCSCLHLLPLQQHLILC